MISVESYSVLGPLDLRLGDGCDCHYSVPLAAAVAALTFYLRQIPLNYLSPSDGGGAVVPCPVVGGQQRNAWLLK